MSGTVTVLVDGVPVADTGADFAAGALVVMMGISLDWGRQTAVDQPDADAVSLSIAQRGGHDLVSRLAVGRAVEIHASGVEFVDVGESTITDGGFESTAPGGMPANATVSQGAGTVSTVRAATGAHSLRVTPTPGQSAGLVVGPAAFSAQDPAAWDGIPRTDDTGAVWPVSVAVWAPLGAAVSVQPALFDSPSGTGTPAGVWQSVTGNGTTWQTVRVDYAATTPDKWIGVLIAVTAPAWQAVPGTWAAAPGAWADYAAAFVDDVTVYAPSGEIHRTALVFSGRITDLQAHYDVALGGGSLVADVTARGFTADLENIRIGDQPWTVEPLSDRVDRILSLAGGTVTAIVDETIADTLVTWRDVDSQPAAGLISELAASVAGVAWSAAHITRGPYYWVEDPDNRSALYVLVYDAGAGYVVIEPAPGAVDAITLDASNVQLSPLRWVQNVADIGTRVDVTWLEQTVNDAGQPAPTERHAVRVDPELESVFGVRGVSLQTQLQAAADADDVGARILARVQASGWRLENVEWDQSFESDIDAREMKTTLDLLDGAVRIGHPLRIENIPSWAPLPPGLVGFIEGGHYEYRHTVTDGVSTGAWSLRLSLSQGIGIGGSVPWSDMDTAWRWNQFSPTISWADLIGVVIG
jgi:hypothetical protein